VSVAPEDLAAARFKPVRQALERIAKAEAARAASAGRLEQLRAAVGPAEHRDREALGQALVDGKAEPPSQAAEIQTELDHEERRGEALRLAVGAARQLIEELVAEHRASWRRQTMRELAKAKRRYENAISELEAARDSLSDEASLVSWLDSGSSAAAASDPLGGRIGLDATGRPAVSFARTLEELRQDAEHLVEHPVSRDDPIAELRNELAWRE
jgi:hypothetical protein